MTVDPREPLLLRPPLAYRAAGWGFVLFGSFFGLSGVVQDGSDSYDWGAGAMMGVLVGLSLGFGISISTAKATVNSSAIRYEYGFVRRAIPSSEVESVAVGPGSGLYYPRICLHIDQRGRDRPLRLLALQRPDTAKGRAVLEETAANVRATVGV
ncbi:hypothetical protein BJ986_000056 [Phycicoccus badiiscoriae]|uniref:Photosystem I assembly protein Ycf4 n=1 Tax=Pedococcus badiiscoriae TaxID=642776 RepID=A0A852W9M1_9MICO|nr:hypothetical protein [Pedococcus badiiscoriae]NYG05569.1 hypothetical protein [Pedococcus badiiscoriae]